LQRHPIFRAVPTPKHTRLALRVAIGAIVLAVLTHTRADPDLFGHVRFGGDLLAARTVHLPDSYSFASDRAWINHEWLAETVMYSAYAAAGAAGLVALKIGLLAAMLAAVALALARYGLPPPARDLVIAFVVVGTFPQANHVRPQLFSLALFAWLLAVFVVSRTRRFVLAWSIPMMAIWVDVHGGWLVGAGALAAWTAAGLVPARTRRDSLVGVVLAAAAMAITLLNPYGWEMWSFLRDTVGFGRADITDWQPVFALGAPYVALWALTASAAIVAIRKAIARGDAELRSIAVVVLFGAASLRVSRLLSFFTLSTAILLGPPLAAAFSRVLEARRETPSASRLATAVAFAVALAIAAGGITASAQNIGCIRMEESLFPEPAVADTVAQRHVRGRMLTWFDWGEYAIWHFAPGVAVSMDGRRETVYSDAEIQRQLKFFFSPDERGAVLAALRPDYVWAPSTLAVTARLIDDGWQPLFAGPRSTLLAAPAASVLIGTGTAGSTIASSPMSGAGAPRCFPGP